MIHPRRRARRNPHRRDTVRCRPTPHPEVTGLSVPSGSLRVMTPLTLDSIADALREAWAADTCSPDDVERSPWSRENPAWGHCDITALVVNDLFGGELVCGEVHLDGEQQGFHWWNRLPSGIDLDLTREQMRLGQVITEVRVVERPRPLPTFRRDEYLLLRDRLAARLGDLPQPGTGHQSR